MRRYRVNDNLHSQFSRTGAPRQRSLDHDPSHPPTAAFGRTRLLGLSSDRALTDFTMAGTVKGVAWSINPYLGCMHSCGYCYVPDTMHLERNRWGTYAAPKHNLPSVLRRELRTRPRRTVYLSTGTDAYQAPEREHQITRRCLRLLLKHDWPIDILTRSPLVLRDLDLLRRFTHCRVGLSVPTLDDAARGVLEPQAPPILARLQALRELADAGVTTYANLAPAYPPTEGITATQVAGTFRAAGVQWANYSHWKRVAGFLGNLWDRLHKTDWRDLVRYAADASRQSAWEEELFAAFGRAGVPIRVGFYNPTFDLTPSWEATSQMPLDVEGETSSVAAREQPKLLTVSARRRASAP